MNKIILSITLIFFLTLISVATFAQTSPIEYTVETQAIGTTNNTVPFWMRSNQYGSIPLSGISANFIGGIHKEFDKTESTLIDWGAGFEGRTNIGKNSSFLLIEGYLKARKGIFHFKGGRTKDVMGLNGDSLLSSGSFAISGNSLGIPKLEVSIPAYWTIPIFNGLFAIKGSIAHGWLGRKGILDSLNGGGNTGRKVVFDNNPKSYFHQKSFYGRLGREEWKLKLFSGFSHNVFWGGEKGLYGNDYKLSPIETLFYVGTGKTYGDNKSIPKSKLGNQLGSIDIGLTYTFKDFNIMLYRQNFYDVGGLSKLANIKDGLNGLTIDNLKSNTLNRTFGWDKFLFEVLYTKNQGGEFNSIRTKSGSEDYYNNYLYDTGWSYSGNNLGTPFISSKYSVREGLPSHTSDYFINNRVIVFHSAINGRVKNWSVIGKASYSINYGTFLTSLEGYLIPGQVYEPLHGLFGKKKQFSSSLECNKQLLNNTAIGVIFATDQGDLLDKSFGILIKAKKTF